MNDKKCFSEFDAKLKEKLCEILAYTVDFLEYNNLKWWLAYGSCLGAIRHGGFIPWDDDIDICMPREDYNRLLSLKSLLVGSNYKIISYDDDGYYMPFAKIIDVTTSLQEVKTFHYVIGAFVDIFPVDAVAEVNVNLRAKYRELFKHYQQSLSTLCFHDYKREFVNHGLKSMGRMMVNCSLGTHWKKHLLRKFVKFDSQINKSDGKYLTVAWFRKFYPSNLFDETSFVPFCNINVRVPKNYELYLRIVYGDYLTLPPIEKRVSKHFHYYYNLRESLCYEEIQCRIKLGENFIC